MKRPRVQHAALMSELARRAERLATFKLVAHVSEWNGRETPRLSIRALAELCDCDKNTAMKAVAEAVTKGWVTRIEFKNSASFQLGRQWFKTSEIFRQSDNGSYDENVGIIQTLSESPEVVQVVNDPESVLKIQTKKPNLAKSVRKIQTLFDGDEGESSGTDVALYACDSPYTLPLNVVIPIESLKDSPLGPPLEATKPKRKPAAKKPKVFNPSDLPSNVFPMWCAIVQLRWQLDAVPEKFAVQSADVARWLVEQRQATTDDFVKFVQWWWHDPDAMGFRQRTRPWPTNVRNNWDTCFSGAVRPEVNAAANGNGNGFKTRADINADRRREQLEIISGRRPIPGDVRPSRPGAALLGPGPAGDGGVFLDRQRLGASSGQRAERVPGRVLPAGSGEPADGGDSDAERGPRGVA